MAEFLVSNRSRWMDSPAYQAAHDRIDASGMNPAQKVEAHALLTAKFNCRTMRLDIISVRPDGAKYGKQELQPANVIIVKVPDYPYEEAKVLAERLWDNTNPDRPVLLKKSKWRLDLNDINVPPPLMEEILRTGTVTVARSAVEQFIKVKT